MGVWSRRGLLTRHERLMRLEKATAERCSPEVRERHIEARQTGDSVAVDTFIVGRLKGVGKSPPRDCSRRPIRYDQTRYRNRSRIGAQSRLIS